MVFSIVLTTPDILQTTIIPPVGVIDISFETLSPENFFVVKMGDDSHSSCGCKAKNLRLKIS
jgi:hypothetical protein